MQSSDRAWIILAVGVVLYDTLADDGQTLSEAVDRYMLRHPWKVRLVAVLVAGHCCNALPVRFDPIHRLFSLKPRA